jgi:hypothetical protein
VFSLDDMAERENHAELPMGALGTGTAWPVSTLEAICEPTVAAVLSPVRRGFPDGYPCSGRGTEWNSAIFHTPLSRRKTSVVGAEITRGRCRCPDAVGELDRSVPRLMAGRRARLAR